MMKAQWQLPLASHKAQHTHQLVCGPVAANAARPQLHASDLTDGALSILQASERDKAKPLGALGVWVPHHTCIAAETGVACTHGLMMAIRTVRRALRNGSFAVIQETSWRNGRCMHSDPHA